MKLTHCPRCGFDLEEAQALAAPKPEREAVKLREALDGVNKYIPELWGDHCQDGMVDLSIPAEVIEQLQAALMGPR